MFIIEYLHVFTSFSKGMGPGMQPNMMQSQNIYHMMNQQRQNMMGNMGGGMTADNYPMGQQNSPAHNAPPQPSIPPNNQSSGPGNMPTQSNQGPSSNPGSTGPGHNQSSAPNSQSTNSVNLKNNSFSPEMLQVRLQKYLLLFFY